MRKWVTISMVGAMFLAGLFLASKTEAVPTFARKYQTSCSTCHYAYPRLNSFGRAFRNNGFRYPGDDKEMVKQDPVSMGAESQKKVFPNTIWPADIPGVPPISLRWVSRMHYEPSHKGHEFTFENPHELEAFIPGTIGDNLSFFFEFAWEHAGGFYYGGRLDYKFADKFHVRLGNIDFLPIQDFERLTREHYNYGSFQDLDGSGLEFWGAANGANNQGGVVYSVGVINGENDGADNFDLNSNKDVFVKASYKIGGLGVLGSTTAGQSVEFWRDNSVTLGAFAQMGRNADAGKSRNLGGNVDLFVGDLDVFGLFMLDQFKAPGSSKYTDTKRAFAEADYVVYPWLIPLLRFQYTKPYAKKAVKEMVPAVVLMVRANVKVVPTARFDLDNNDNNRYNIQVEVGI